MRWIHINVNIIVCVCVVFLFSASNRPNLEHATQQWYYDNEDESSLNNDIIVFFLFVIFHYMMIVAAATKHVQILSNHFQINVQPISSHSTCVCACVCVCVRARLSSMAIFNSCIISLSLLFHHFSLSLLFMPYTTYKYTKRFFYYIVGCCYRSYVVLCYCDANAQ